MTETEEKISLFEFNDKQFGIVLGLWDQEKTSALIKDLESSVNSIENKCKHLLQLLLLYRSHFEKIQNFDCRKFSSNFKEKEKNHHENQIFLSDSDPELAFQKSVIKIQELEEKFEENFKEELRVINDILSEAARKMGLKNKFFLFPTEKYLNSINAKTIAQTEMSCPELLEKFVGNVPLSKSKCNVTEEVLVDGGFSKITRNELELYQKLTGLTSGKKKGRKFTDRSESKRLIKKQNNLKYVIKELRKESPKKNSKNKAGKASNRPAKSPTERNRVRLLKKKPGDRGTKNNTKKSTLKRKFGRA